MLVRPGSTFFPPEKCDRFCRITFVSLDHDAKKVLVLDGVDSTYSCGSLQQFDWEVHKWLDLGWTIED